MYTMLIVNDNSPSDLSTLCAAFLDHMIDSEHCILGNDAEALHGLEEGSVDTVLTDARMQNVTGIELIKRTEDHRILRCSIFLSFYSDCHQARRDVLNGSFDLSAQHCEEETMEASVEGLSELLMPQEIHRKRVVQNESRRLAGYTIRCCLNKLDGAMQAAADTFKKNCLTIGEFSEWIELLLLEIRAQICVEYPFIEAFMPLKRIAALSSNDCTAKQQILTLHRILHFLAKKLQLFSLASSHPLIRTVRQYILNHIEEPCRIRDIAEFCYVNPKYLSTLFKRETGIYLKDYISDLKIEHAKCLLLSGHSVQAAAEKLRYCDPEYFSKVFDRKVGIKPSRFNEEAYLSEL